MKTMAFLLLANVLLSQEGLKQVAVGVDSSSKSVMLIDPKSRASDFIQAFDSLRKDRPAQKIFIKTTSSEFVNVADMSSTSGGTLLFVKILSSQGIRTMIVPVEQIMEIGYSP